MRRVALLLTVGLLAITAAARAEPLKLRIGP